MRFALSLGMVSDIGADALLVDSGGNAAHVVTHLARAADAVSFSGFIAANPGTYTVEVRFTGALPSSTDRIFLGRYTSDTFTVVKGHTVEAKFSAPIDTVGGPGDNGDPDQDGFGNLDEFLWGTDPHNPDTDGDQLRDGEDCDPTNRALSYAILSGGSHEDCDADHYRRPDIPYSNTGDDCNDKDPTIHPGAMEDPSCTDPVDRDCNPATCPSSDMTPPTITSIDPPPNSTVGCQTVVSATIQDNVAVQSAALTIVEPAPYGQIGFPLAPTSAGSTKFVSPPFNRTANFMVGLMPGLQMAQLSAQDPSGNKATMDVSYTFQFDVPVVTRLDPAMIGVQSAPFTVTIEATSNIGIASLALMAAPKNGSGLYILESAMMLGMSSSSPAMITVNPAQLMQGDYLIYVVVRDRIGNASQPSDTVIVNGGVDVDYNCAPTTTRRLTPVRTLLVGASNAYAPVTVRHHLTEALATAQAMAPGSQLVQIIAFGLKPDGTIALDDPASYQKRIEYAFYNATTMKAATILYLTPAWMGVPQPMIDLNAGNVTVTDPIANVTGLADSDAVASAFTASGVCPTLMGGDNDYISYIHTNSQDEVFVSTGGKTWIGAAVPLSTISPCP
jgi:hypothetical protein